MFTVKWIASNGAEMLYEGSGISYTPAGEKAGGGAKSQVSFDMAEGCHCSLDSGRVYVMNAQGRTVSDYVLSTDEFPHGLAPRQAA